MIYHDDEFSWGHENMFQKVVTEFVNSVTKAHT